ncbi:hypothetical protein CXB51_015737 [Gossypium anomalum]|uniref:Purple acid phosphatase n=1 Tax=Gossypium anomalum TaxID=47600 RepID=A0A8J5YLB1_9ROSI|nr:hypothetical protein CXB51_015737 [Gossypium anomalum]
MALLIASDTFVLYFLCFILCSFGICNGGITGNFVRKKYSPDMPLDSDVFQVPSGYNAPQQVHITQGDMDGSGVIISWITPDEPGSNMVYYWSENSNHKNKAEGIIVRYFDYYNAGFCLVSLCFVLCLVWFLKTGDLGQTHDSNVTLTHYESNPKKGQTVLYVGDLSYSNDYPFHDNSRWDTWGRFVERNAACQPWIWTAGNHELDFAPEIVCHSNTNLFKFNCPNGLTAIVVLQEETTPFKPYTHRYYVPYESSRSTSPLWYSIKRASAYIIVLSSYSAYGETMRVVYESWFVKYKVDVVFSGHVHAYERSKRISNIAYNILNGKCTPAHDLFAPVYITIGDGGNHDGPALGMVEPQPNFSAYREASFGHGVFDIKNRTHAYFGWHRNQDGYAVEADSLWFHNRYWNPYGKSFVTSYDQSM